MNDRYERETTAFTRRTVLATAAGTAAFGLAGCASQGSTSGGSTTSGSGDDGDGTTGETDAQTDVETVTVASFFTFFDFARKVAEGTPVAVDNLVPVGLHGHGWEPDPSITRDIVDADAFVHVGSDFQPWADRAIQTVRDDGADTHFINVREGVDLVPLAESLDEEEEGVGEGRGRDPHFWLDPTRAKQAVDNIRAGFVEIAPENESEFADNADSVRAELDVIDEEWQAIFDAAERDVVFLAAHNAFEYLGDRYDATIRPLVTNLAATDDVRPEDMRRAQETIAGNGIRYMGAAVFEPRRPARQLLENTGVEAYFPVTPFAGTRPEWNERGWGYFEIARQINMPSFEIVLGVSEPGETSLGEKWRNFE